MKHVLVLTYLALLKREMVPLKFGIITGERVGNNLFEMLVVN